MIGSAMPIDTQAVPPHFSKLSFLGVTFLVILGGFFYMAGKNIESGKLRDYGTLSVTGDATVTALPTLGRITVGVLVDREPSASNAVAKLKDGITQVLAAMKDLGVADKDVSTSSLSLGPSYDYADGTQRLRGYTASQMITVKTKTLDRVGDYLNAAADAGANQAGNVEFVVENPDAKTDEARKTAIAEAQKKAQDTAMQLGVTLGKLKGYAEATGGLAPSPVYARAQGLAADGGSLPVPAGEQQVTMTVTLTYEVR